LLIELRGTDPNYDYSVSPERVDVSIRGGLERLSQVTPDLIRPDVDLAGFEPGVHEVRVSVGLPSGVQNDGVLPPTVSVTVTEHHPEPVDNQPDQPQPEPSDGDDEESSDAADSLSGG